MNPPTLIDLFAGCGGMTRGFVDAGYKPVRAVEHDLFAAATYEANFGEDHVFYGDIEDLLEEKIPKVDLIIGGPPCQGFSQLGLEDVDDPRNRLWREYMRVVLTAEPKMFVIENVTRFLKSPEYGILELMVKNGKLRDYRIEAKVLNTADYGIAQKRKRVIVIGCRKDIGEPTFPNPTHTESDATALLEQLRPWETLKSVLKGVDHQVDITELPERTKPHFGKHVPGHFRGKELHIGRNPQPISIERYRQIGPGENRRALPDRLLTPCWRKHKNGSGDVMGRLEWTKPSVTIRTEFFKPEKGRYLHPEFDRPITHLEAALIQGFTRSYKWCGPKLEIARQIGNAVPPLFAQRIAEATRQVIG